VGVKLVVVLVMVVVFGALGGRMKASEGGKWEERRKKGMRGSREYNEGEKGGRVKRRKDLTTEGRRGKRREGGKEERREGGKEGKTEGRKDGRTEGRKDGRTEGGKGGGGEGGNDENEGRKWESAQLRAKESELRSVQKII
jgi:hypothetical protein